MVRHRGLRDPVRARRMATRAATFCGPREWHNIDLALSKSFPWGKRGDAAPSIPVGVFQHPESPQLRRSDELHRFRGVWNHHFGASRSSDPARRTSGVLAYANSQDITRFLKASEPTRSSRPLPSAFRHPLGGPVCVQAIISWFVPKAGGLSVHLFFLVAVFATAWMGGYIPGAMAWVASPWSVFRFWRSRFPANQRRSQPLDPAGGSFVADQPGGSVTAQEARSTARSQR